MTSRSRVRTGSRSKATSTQHATLPPPRSGCTDPLALTKDEKDLTYVLEELTKLKEADVTSELWQDFYESWASFLSLRSRLEAQCAQQIFDAIATDESVFKGLGAAYLLKDAVIKSGQVPAELLLQPGAVAVGTGGIDDQDQNTALGVEGAKALAALCAVCALRTGSPAAPPRRRSRRVSVARALESC